MYDRSYTNGLHIVENDQNQETPKSNFHEAMPLAFSIACKSANLNNNGFQI